MSVRFATPSLHLLLASLVAFAVYPAFAVEIDTPLHEFEKSMEQSLQEKIRTVYRDEATVAISVHAEAELPAKGSVNKARSRDVGYIPFDSAVLDDMNGETEPAAPPFLIKSLEVEIDAPDSLDPAVLSGVQQIVQSSLKGGALKGITPTVKIQTVGLSRKPLDWKIAVLPVSALLAVVLLSLVLGTSLREAARSIAGGLRVAMVGKKDEDKDLKFTGVLEGKTPGTPEKNPELVAKKFTRDVALIRQMLVEDPVAVGQGIRESETEWRGIRALLAELNEQERANLKKVLGPRVSGLLMQDSSEAAPSTFDLTAWVTDFVERVMVQKLKGDSEIEKIIGVDAVGLFASARPEALLAAAQKLNLPGGWRIFAEYYPRNKMSEVFRASGDERLWGVVSSGDATNEEIQSACQAMLPALRDGGTVEEDGEKLQFYRSNLMEPVVKYLQEREQGGDEDLLEQISRTAPDLAGLIRERFWTPSRLDAVPDSYLRSAVLELSYDQKTALLVSLPEAQAKRIESLLPEGNAKTITQDYVQRMRTKADPQDFKRALETTKQFLDYLRRQAAAGKFTLVERPDLRLVA